MKQIHYIKFSDNSEITIYEDITAQIIHASTGFIAWDLWQKVSNDTNLPKSSVLGVFIHLCHTLNSKYFIITEEIDFVKIESDMLYNQLCKSC